MILSSSSVADKNIEKVNEVVIKNLSISNMLTVIIKIK